MARKLGKHTVALTAAIAAAGLAIGTASAQPKMVQKLGKGEGKVDIVAWPGYIERGATDKNFDWVTEFEKKTGCKVNVKTAGTSDEMVALMNEGGFDLVTASGDASLRLIAGKRVQPVNVSLIPSHHHVVRLDSMMSRWTPAAYRYRVLLDLLRSNPSLAQYSIRAESSSRLANSSGMARSSPISANARTASSLAF